MEDQIRVETFAFCSCGRPLLGPDERTAGHCERCAAQEQSVQEALKEYFQEQDSLSTPLIMESVVMDRDEDCPF